VRVEDARWLSTEPSALLQLNQPLALGLHQLPALVNQSDHAGPRLAHRLHVAGAGADLSQQLGHARVDQGHLVAQLE